MSDHNANQTPARNQIANVAQGHALRADGCRACTYSIEVSGPHYIDTPAPLSQSAEGMTAEQEARELAASLMDPDRCPICHWTLAGDASDGCEIGNCSYRPTSAWEQALMRRRRKDFDIATKKVAAFAEHRTAALTAELEQVKTALRDAGVVSPLTREMLHAATAQLQLRPESAESKAESSAALVKELAQNFELLYSRVTLTEIKAWFGEEDGRKLVCTHRKAESLLSHPAVQKVMEEK